MVDALGGRDRARLEEDLEGVHFQGVVREGGVTRAETPLIG